MEVSAGSPESQRYFSFRLLPEGIANSSFNGICSSGEIIQIHNVPYAASDCRSTVPRDFKLLADIRHPGLGVARSWERRCLKFKEVQLFRL
jgi:hypothetical protein